MSVYTIFCPIFYVATHYRVFEKLVLLNSNAFFDEIA